MVFFLEQFVTVAMWSDFTKIGVTLTEMTRKIEGSNRRYLGHSITQTVDGVYLIIVSYE